VAGVGEQGQGARDQAAGDLGNEECAREGSRDGDFGLACRKSTVVAAVVMVMAAMVVPAGVVVAPAVVTAAVVVIVSRAQVVIVVRRSNPFRILA
jgi:hypothetical protein